MSQFFQKHIFFCLNQRDNGADSCAKHNAQAVFDYTKKQVHAQGLSGQGQVRVNRAGCLGRCESGPVCVVYPEGRWYQYVDQSDIDEIIEQDLKQNKPVERLLLD
jgi:(2Fe-2S) ferredoxin